MRLPCAKNVHLIAIANPACSATTTMRRIFEVLTSVALRTGYKLRRRKKADAAKPTATKA